MKVHLYLGFNEPMFLNTNGARTQYLQNIKRKVTQDSNLIDYVAFIDVLEEPYTLIDHGLHYGRNWATLRGLTYEQQLQRMKQGLEEYIAEVKVLFPGIPVMIEEAAWNDSYVPPDNLDILGLGAYYTPSTPQSNQCDEEQRAKFNREFVEAYNKAKTYNKPIYLVAPSFKDSTYHHLSPCQMDWYFEIARNDAQVIGLDWFLYNTVDRVEGFKDANPSGLNHLKEKGMEILASLR